MSRSLFPFSWYQRSSPFHIYYCRLLEWRKIQWAELEFCMVTVATVHHFLYSMSSTNNLWPCRLLLDPNECMYENMQQSTRLFIHSFDRIWWSLSLYLYNVTAFSVRSFAICYCTFWNSLICFWTYVVVLDNAGAVKLWSSSNHIEEVASCTPAPVCVSSLLILWFEWKLLKLM